MKPFSLLIKPASADCNLRCAYCFYLDRSELYPDTKIHRMSDEVLERMIAGYMGTRQPQYTFGWQGGEPTLMGVDFFRKVVKLQKQYGRPGAVVANGLQTNAVLITDEFAEHLAKYNFLLGVSIDGPAEIHNHYRKNAAGNGSHADVMQGVEALKRHKVEFNALNLVSSANVDRPKETFRYLCDLGIMHHQYIPCVEFDAAGRPLPFTITGKQWGDFLCGIYDMWMKEGIRKVSVRLFDSILTLLVTNTYNICHMGRNCCQYFVVEHNGDVYPCDFFVQEGLKLGDLDDSWEELAQSQTYLDFGAQKAEWNEACTDCPALPLCSGDCLKHRLPCGGGDPKTLSWLCEGWKQFYAYAMPGFKRIAKEIQQQRERERQAMLAQRRQQMMARNRPQVSRNDPCPCGSGKKYKKCCGA